MLNLRGRGRQLQILSDELDREIAQSAQRATAMEQRGAVLIGAAGIAGALRLGDNINALTLAALVLTFAAAVAGLVVMFPRKGQLLNVRAARTDILRMHPLSARYHLDDTKMEILEADQKWLDNRGHITRIGFVLLALSIAVGVAGTLAAVPTEIAPSPSPTP
ncbi:hypothetical protein [Microbacterium oxydans]|uniref:Uncharacterized protein n=1 Tax=Microbacterium oxydans TaxID=82380 RepID=A0A0F0LAK5_9MICO|nr:hypothetical protein [Microbacterium oxydans]KJL30222.1 hypothetical protein RS83_00972 [Microbacterium oxydans]